MLDRSEEQLNIGKQIIKIFYLKYSNPMADESAIKFKGG